MVTLCANLSVLNAAHCSRSFTVFTGRMGRITSEYGWHVAAQRLILPCWLLRVYFSHWISSFSLFLKRDEPPEPKMLRELWWIISTAASIILHPEEEGQRKQANITDTNPQLWDYYIMTSVLLKYERKAICSEMFTSQITDISLD